MLYPHGDVEVAQDLRGKDGLDLWRKIDQQEYLNLEIHITHSYKDSRNDMELQGSPPLKLRITALSTSRRYDL